MGCKEYCRRFGVVEQRRVSSQALLRGLSSPLVNHGSLVDSVLGFLRQDMGCDIDVYLRSDVVTGAAVRRALVLQPPKWSNRLV